MGDPFNFFNKFLNYVISLCILFLSYYFSIAFSEVLRAREVLLVVPFMAMIALTKDKYIGIQVVLQILILVVYAVIRQIFDMGEFEDLAVLFTGFLESIMLYLGRFVKYLGRNMAVPVVQEGMIYSFIFLCVQLSGSFLKLDRRRK
ncbi:MAG: hypothetical protein PHQ23_06095 [Candidatus Wallbacteria bacterium]|nr:hypothetical protein [Candidatus Wallbacteria bacterium]